MEAWFLREWQRNSPWQLLLRPLSWLFQLVVSIRRFAFRRGLLASTRLGVPVLVVGNITVGGSGKTPLVLALALRLRAAGYQPGIITRGYRPRSAAGARPPPITHVLADAGAEPVSDEAALLAARSEVPVYAGVDRPAVAQALLAAHPQVNVILSDDGLQHYALHRDLEICVIDGERGLGNGALLPAGPLRETSQRLREVDALVINGAAGAPVEGAAGARSFAMQLGNESFISLHDGRALAPTDWQRAFAGRRIAMVAGTGNPGRFFSHLARLRIDGATHAFADHHPYTSADLAGIDAEVIVMTEKDAVKCGRFADQRLWFMRVDAILPEAFDQFVLAHLSHLQADLKA